MIRSMIPVALGLTIVVLSADSAWAQRGRRNGNVSTPYGQFSAAEMAQAGGDVNNALQLREQKQMMQYQQQMLKQQQVYMQQQAKQQEFLKKHPEAAKALTQTKSARKKAAPKSDKKDKDKDASTETTVAPTTKAKKST